MEENARQRVARIPSATYTCVVLADDLEEMGTKAWEACQKYFGKQPFAISSLDAERNLLHHPGEARFRAQVRAEAT